MEQCDGRERRYAFSLQEYLDVMWQKSLRVKLECKEIDTFFKKYGKNTVLICRLLPFVSFDIVSYAAGLTSMSFISFLWQLV